MKQKDIDKIYDMINTRITQNASSLFVFDCPKCKHPTVATRENREISNPMFSFVSYILTLPPITCLTCGGKFTKDDCFVEVKPVKKAKK